MFFWEEHCSGCEKDMKESTSLVLSQGVYLLVLEEEFAYMKVLVSVRIEKCTVYLIHFKLCFAWVF